MLLLCRVPRKIPPDLLTRAECLSPAWRLEKARRLSPSGRGVSLAAGLLLELALRRAGVPCAGSCDEQGRPRPAFGVPPYVSLSHSGEYAACALADRPVGVDVQKPVGVHPRLPRRVCTPSELAALAVAARPDRHFSALWALKESLIKASLTDDPIGLMGRSAFSLPGDLTALSEMTPVQGPDGFDFWLGFLPEGHSVALCLSRTDAGKRADRSVLPPD